MKIPEAYIKIFPEYQDVFYDDLDNHKKYFLPLCSINLGFISKDKNYWLHFISVKEIYNGSVGQTTTSFHSEFTKYDMFGFDILDGKYKFDSEWDYFTVSREILPGNLDIEYTDEEIQFNFNQAMYELKKSYYKKFGKLYDKDFYRPGLTVNGIRKLERLLKLTPEDLYNDKDSEYVKEHQKKKINGVLLEINIDNLPLDECSFSGENLIDKPLDKNGNLFDYIACMEGYDFQQDAADQIYLFHNFELKKAVICLEYT
ncbi:hypothetical protein ASE21_05985 [Flavobacterium sp. Root901]|uniref:hypothetical protein n=1 Tax=Flavobacterium sp. Root901 TaxID=1736605 RepID=UPI000710A454|nr:hypothetical protein [Flavobacterium sp. Root901]KRD11253.1 hypothetical protein ASE21_05985 [Flavobacterium sp. Root901]